MVSQPPYRALLFCQFSNCDTMTFHTEIRHPDDPPHYKERQIIPPRNDKHAAKMREDLRRLHLDFLRKKKRRYTP